MNNSVPAVESGSRPAPRWSLRLFGGFELGTFPTGQKVVLPGKRERALLAYLALSPKGRQPRRKLAALIWGDASDQTLLDNLRTCVWRLRKALGDTEHRLLASDDEDIVLDIAAFDIDALAFRRLAAQTGQAELEAAAMLCQGEFLDGFELDSEEFEFWLRNERSQYLDQSVDLLSRLMKLLMDGGQSERAIETGAHILRLDPLHEATARHMMRLYADSGRRGTAIQLYRTLTQALLKDVDTQPEAETRQVIAAIAQSAELPAAANDRIDAASPANIPMSARKWRPSLMVLTAACLAAIALGSTWWMLRASGPADTPAGLTAAPPITVAVLPFANLPGDPAQQFFSDGVTQEISATLAKVPGLQLIARASTFRFRDSKDARQIGAQLGVRYLIEGTVRKDGDRVRITAQLVPADTGKPVWSHGYERSLAGTLAIQEEIAADVAQALNLSPGDKHLASGRDIDPASYEQFLRALPLIRARQMGVVQAIEILEPLVERNPKFAPAWALLAYAYSLRPAVLPLQGVSPYGPEGIAQRRARTKEFWPKAETAARRAIQLDPKLPTAYLAFGAVEHFRGKLLAAEDLFAKALSLDPYNPDILAWRMALLAGIGRQSEALAVAQQLLALEPYVPAWKGDIAEVLWENERYDSAIQLLQTVQEMPSGASDLAMVYASQGRFQDSAAALENWANSRSEMFQGQKLRFRAGAALLRVAPTTTATLPQSLHIGRMSFAYLYVGAPERSLELYEDDIESGFAGGFGTSFSFLWHPSYAPARKTERFKSLMRAGGMVDYWRQRGWPSFCRPLGSQDFACT